MTERLRPCATARSIIWCHCVLIEYPPASPVVVAVAAAAAAAVVVIVIVIVIVLVLAVLLFFYSFISHVLFSCKRIVSTHQSFVFASGFVYIDFSFLRMLALVRLERVGRLFYL